MSSAVYARIRANPKFQQLVTTRGKFAWTLAITVLAVFYGFVMLIAFQPEFLGRAIADGSKLTIGVAFGVAIFVSFWLLTALYVRRANGEFDALTAEIVKEARDAEFRAIARKEAA
jgi:uncharacterized membrane protein (DUF485 family)